MDLTLAIVIAHFDPRGRVAINLYDLVKHLATLTPRIVFVSTGIAPEEVARVSKFAKVIARENYGYDFWSYKLGIDALGDKTGLQRLILCNSSFVTFDPRLLCDAFFAALVEPGLRGITASRERGQWHAQSYWVAFEHGELINSPDFVRWWSDMVPISDRFEVINRYELGMSAKFASLGVPVKSAFVPSLDDLLIAACRAVETRHWRVANLSQRVTLDLELARSLNPTLFLWDSLLAQFAVVKLGLLLNNPFGLNLTSLYSRIEQSGHLNALVRDATSP
jgi:lipopolysaccharide biosynthesis protein